MIYQNFLRIFISVILPTFQEEQGQKFLCFITHSKCFPISGKLSYLLKVSFLDCSEYWSV
jgi:hypothetical protein